MEKTINIESITDNSELLEYISMRDDIDFKEYAKDSFKQFCDNFYADLCKQTEIICKKWNYDIIVATEIVECTFARVWKYPSGFKKEKSKTKDIYKAILFWLNGIARTQLVNYHHTHSCYKPTEEEDLSIIYNIEEMIEYKAGENIESKRELRIALSRLEEILDTLNEKKKIIYLTYKTYETKGKYLPRTVLEQLQTKLGLTQPSIRKYKNDTYIYIKERLSCQR